MTGYVYAIRSGDRIKIGWSKNPWMRLVKICSDSPHQATLIGCTEGDRLVEASYHSHWAQFRVHGEWFDCHPSIMDIVSRWPLDRPKKRPVGSKLHIWRKQNGLTLAELGNALGLEASFVSRMERYINYPSVAVYLRLRELTGGEITFDDLIDPALLSPSLKRKGEAA